MAKRFTDTNKYKKAFIRGLQGAYKLFWDYLYHDCDHAGIWIVDFEIAQLYLGQDMLVNKADALKYFNQDDTRIIEISGGKKWFIKPFIDFQYGELNPANRAHNSVIKELEKYNLVKGNKPLISPLQGAMDKDKDKDKDKEGEITPKKTPNSFDNFWNAYPRKVGKGAAFKSWQKIKPSVELSGMIITAVEQQKKSSGWVKDSGQYIPNPATWLNQQRWLDEVSKSEMPPAARKVLCDCGCNQEAQVLISGGGNWFSYKHKNKGKR